MFFTYVLISERHNKFCIGFTDDLQKRIEEYQKGAVASTAHRRQLRLIYYEACLNAKDAMKRDKYLKTGFGRRFLKNRLESYMEKTT